MSYELYLFIARAAIVACILLMLLLLFVLFKYLWNLNQQKKKNLLIKQRKFDSFKSLGFRSTAQYKIENQFIAVDENSKRWFIMNMDNPQNCELHKFSEIKSVNIKKDSHRVGSSQRGRLMKGFYISKYESHSELTQLLLIINLNNLNHPTKTINFIRHANMIDSIKNVFETMKLNAE